jgi:hypothetical protein
MVAVAELTSPHGLVVEQLEASAYRSALSPNPSPCSLERLNNRQLARYPATICVNDTSHLACCSGGGRVP